MNHLYETLVNAFQSLDGTAAMLDSDRDDDFERLPEFFDANRPQLDRARAALRQKPSIPLEYHADWLSKSADSRTALRHLACVFGAELRLAAHRRDLARAAEIAVDGLDLANGIRRGGLHFDALFSNACTNYLLGLLSPIRKELTAASRNRLHDELVRIERERESVESIESRDNEWEKIVSSQRPEDLEIERLIDDLESSGEIFAEEKKRGVATDGLRADMKEHFQFGKAEQRRGATIDQQRAIMKEVYEAEKNSKSSTVAKTNRMQADLCGLCLLRMMRIDLKLRSLKEEKGYYPENLEQLRREPGEAMLLDPFTSRPFIYRRKFQRRFFSKTEVGFDLYSPGPSQFDHGGNFGSWPQVVDGKADLGLDWADYQENN